MKHRNGVFSFLYEKRPLGVIDQYVRRIFSDFFDHTLNSNVRKEGLAHTLQETTSCPTYVKMPGRVFAPRDYKNTGTIKAFGAFWDL